jgi:plastocyanin
MLKVTGVAMLLGVQGAAAGSARAEEAPRPGPTAADFARLQNEVREQRQLIIQMMQNEQQRYDMLLKLIQGGSAAVTPAMLSRDAPGPGPAEAAPAATAPAPSGASARAAAEPVRRTGSVEGRVSVQGGSASEVYVYVENVRTGQTRGRTVEIRQEGKQFSPRVAVVQTGTTVVFPNYDAVFHNVFSSSPGNAFDLGSYRSGDKARGVTLSKPGVVDVFCNMHQKMSASVLVVPSPLYTKVKADGSFRLDNVPIGARKLVAWSPNARVAQQKVEVTGASATSVTFALEREEAKAHANKLGQPYGSYRD